MSKKETQTQIACRLDDSLLERVDKLAERMSQPGLSPVTRTDLIRMFVTQGTNAHEALLENAEKQSEKQRRKR